MQIAPNFVSEKSWERSLPWQQITPWIVPLGLLVIWQLLAQFGFITTRILPAPTQIVEAAIRLSISGEMFRNVSISLWRAMLGFIIGGSIGLGLGVLNGASPTAERLLDSSIQMIRNVPHLSLIPLVILWFGIGDEARIFLVVLGVFFPIYINTFHGIRSIDPHLVEMGKVYGLRSRDLFWQIILPGALPNILVGLRYALGLMWLTLIVAETIAANSGIGYMAMNAREFMQTDVVVLSILLYALLGKVADTAVRLLERWWLPWHPSQQM
ncbi:aliphatic sulfonate ABC transporter permease SsuC [Oculatella sp. LEGE 06141]|uniref:aliphatic sulfonate ABC transporter permease SsuC n=1 Tax=Oculatella sp. LEGE 06141 TaxID=1828648 RepID=UPI0018825767|nr:aliphatic sulfonate ABC transporter permease SsuC [Oculatella sp. LEGE 06141]MBE9182939.1 aliphatic sulfonate ABC transporter permease SsuC [Oculatella sp. LEGE 06141]